MELAIIGGIVALLTLIPKKADTEENIVVKPLPIKPLADHTILPYIPGVSTHAKAGVYLPKATGDIVTVKGTIGGNSAKVIDEVNRGNEKYYSPVTKQTRLGSIIV